MDTEQKNILDKLVRKGYVCCYYGTEREEVMKQRKKNNTRRVYFHVSHINNMSSINESGLKLNGDGMLFLFDDKKAAAKIAVDQVGLFDSYSLFEVELTAEQQEQLEDDNVAEIIDGMQYILKTPIAANQIRLLNNYFVNLKRDDKLIRA